MKQTMLLLMLSLCSPLMAQVSEREPVLMGASRINITPVEPVLMSGYDARKTPSTGIHDELFASALCFSDLQTKVLIITADVIGFSHSLTDEIVRDISSATGIGADHILLTAAHNHGGPSIRTYTDDIPAGNERYIQSLREKLVQVSLDAAETLNPVKMGVGIGYCSMNINRRAKFADGSIWLGRNQDGPCDHEVAILKFEDAQEGLVGLHVNWPCHGTASGQENYEITGDWPGAAARFLGEQLGGETVVGITAGASGDINPIYGPGDNFREIEAVGFNLAEEVMSVIPDIETFQEYDINSIQKTIILPGKKRGDSRFPQDEYEPGPDVEIRLSAMKVGNMVFAGISGEVMTEIGMEIKAKSPYTGTIIVTHCNGSSGYICTDKAFGEGGYEVQVTRLMPGAEEAVVHELTEMISAL
ncbi:MAG: neutral/alkaline non-lysosomal ceramidase N-terminal domain-containing protein [Bacteroidales bacterium]